MAEKEKQAYSLCCDNNVLTVKGVTQVVEITEREAQLKLVHNSLFIKGNGLNVTKLDKDQGIVVMEYSTLTSLAFRNSGVSFKGLFR